MGQDAIEPIEIQEDIRKAATLPGRAYTDPAIFALSRERVFARSWQFAGDADRVKVPGQVQPFTLLEGMLDEPLLFTRDGEDRLHCVSNVCTHRGNLVVETAGVARELRCRYHGRRFGMDGRFLSMPEFEGAEGFPRDSEGLSRVAFGGWEKLLFASLSPLAPLDDVIGGMRARMGWTPLAHAAFDASRSREYLVRANWALYVDNYLEGFHIPYIHPDLAGALDYGSYVTELYPYASVQVGAARDGEDAFDLPPSSPDHGKRIAAYYFWVFPNTMFNFYPWGVSINVVMPLAVDRTKVAFLSFVWDPSRVETGAGAALDRVEREDEVIVENVQRALRGRLYDRGRYSPVRETGVHHFHRLLARFLSKP